MGITIEPVTPTFVAEVGDMDLAAPLAGDVLEEIKEALWHYAVLVFPDQALTPDQHVAFAQHFGPLETDTAQGRKVSQARLGDSFADVSNLDHENKVWAEGSRQREFQLANRLWHTDSSFKRIPSLCSLLYARSVVPVGGHTEFADARAAYDGLEPEMQATLAGRVVEHSIFNSRKRLGFSDFNEEDFQRLPPVPQALVRTVPQSGRKALYLASHAGRIFDMPEEEGSALIETLVEQTTRRQHVHTHRWRLHDLVMWDNRCTMHRGTPFDDLRYRRDVQRVTIRDVANSCEQEGLRVGE